MTDTPMTPDREQEIRTLDLLELMSDRVAPVISGHLAALLGEIDRLRKALSEAADQVAELDDVNAQLHHQIAAQRSTAKQLLARVAELETLKPARFQDCQVCGAGYEYGKPCAACEFNKQMATATASNPAAKTCAFKNPHEPQTNEPGREDEWQCPGVPKPAIP
ncbi:hypothetical protein GTY67_13455 [Streptomyces sp. SID8374]|uniref:hypothetical protein n=1 Tax=Streptomyces sp. SID8374 TaxID=2690354 RepID=UPI001370D150|nr:hypothetical protein [Streptomyces sp. SID8374]MYX14403.1 hypothetical protein [Streptomyces sp. SID8374]